MAMAAAMREAGVGAGDVDYVSAGAHSSPLLDAREARAMGSVFSARGARPAVGSIKSMIGETIGAAGALQAIAAAAALETDVIPHTVNLEDPDPGSDLDFVMKIPRRTRVNRIVMNSIDPGGAAVTLVVRRVEA
jgi:3-oxoacyl-[acyl-carrier-protein] synthase II